MMLIIITYIICRRNNIKITKFHLRLFTFCSLSYFKGYSLLRTNNMNETIKILIQFIKKIDKEHKQGKEGYIQSNKTGNIGDKTEPNDDYCSNIKVKKKKTNRG